MAPTDPIRIIRHEPVPDCGSFDVRFQDGRESVYFYWDDNAFRRGVSREMTQADAMEAAKDLARVERDRLK
jgi:hypothetical protein